MPRYAGFDSSLRILFVFVWHNEYLSRQQYVREETEVKHGRLMQRLSVHFLQVSFEPNGCP